MRQFGFRSAVSETAGPRVVRGIAAARVSEQDLDTLDQRKVPIDHGNLPSALRPGLLAGYLRWQDADVRA